MISRQVLPEFQQLMKEYPVVTILGPRQAGKTTLARVAFPHYQYINLEIPDIRQLAQDDPRAFLSGLSDQVILDEIQRVPELLSYIQGIVDENQQEGQFILTGSHQLQLREAINQSLAGRTGLLTLLPFSISELESEGISFETKAEYIFNGFLPRVYDKKIRPATAYSNYYQTYVERDVRQLIHLKDAALFEKFMKLVAGRVGQLMDYASLANDVGVSSGTIKSWLSILEASFVVIKLPPYYKNFGKRLVKAAKYYFVDTGLLSYLLGIQKASQVDRDPLIGNIFENLVIVECFKQQLNKGIKPNFYFFRDSNGLEVDLLWENGREIVPVEIKSASSYDKSLLKGLKKFSEIYQYQRSYLVFSGESRALTAVELKNFKGVSDIFH